MGEKVYLFNMPVGLLNYDRPKNASTTETALEAEYRVSFPVANKALVEWYSTLDPANVAQISTVTLTAGSTGDEYAVRVTVGSDVNSYRHKMTSGQTATQIAAFLATIINTNPAVEAKSSTGVITVTSLVPGQAFTLANTDSTTVGNVVIATTTANSGTALHRKIGEIEVTFSITSAGYPSVSTSGKWHDGAAVPVVKQTFGPLVGTGNATVDSIQTAAGVARPA